MKWFLGLLVSLAAAIHVAGFGQALHPVLDSIATFRLHITVVLAAGVLALLAARKWVATAAAGAVIAASLVAMRPAILTEEDSPLGSYVHVHANAYFKNKTPEKIAELIQSNKADSASLQEVSAGNHLPVVATIGFDPP